jgi:hypothetical protein
MLALHLSDQRYVINRLIAQGSWAMMTARTAREKRYRQSKVQQEPRINQTSDWPAEILREGQR